MVTTTSMIAQKRSKPHVAHLVGLVTPLKRGVSAWASGMFVME